MKADNNSNKIIGILQLLLFTCLVTFFMSECEEYEYPEEPTSEGLNTHGFKVNGVNWVKESSFESSPYAFYLMDAPGVFYLNASLSANIEGEDKFPSGGLIWRTFERSNDVDIPKEYPFADYIDLFTIIDSSLCYIYFVYQEGPLSGLTFYENVLSGSVVYTKYDSIISGTFNLDIASDTDTINITDGKFDYVIQTL